jgi:parallel beta-helix repeat protein
VASCSLIQKVTAFRTTNVQTIGILASYWIDQAFTTRYRTTVATRYTRAGRGISIPGSYNNILYNNCSRLDDGIYITGSYNNVSNNICSNSEYGIYSKSRNRIYLNNFINNIRGNVKSSTNTWNSPEKISYTYHEAHFTNYLGNYWDDYEGIDEDGNGLGDTPYQIDKSEGDLFPLMERFENYIVEVEEPTEFLVAGSNPSGAYICSDP